MTRHVVILLLACFQSSLASAQSSLQKTRELAMEGIGAVRNGELLQAKGFFENAIAASPWDKGRMYSCGLSEFNDGRALEHGMKQLNALLLDRPYMNSNGIRNSIVFDWCVQRFGGLESGLRIVWNPEPPSSGAFAEHYVSNERPVIEIRIAKQVGENDVERFERSWAALVFELINSTYWIERQMLYDAIGSDDISRDFFIRQIFVTELSAAHKCRAFYVRVYLPWAARAGTRSEAMQWYTDQCNWGTPETTLGFYSNRNSYPWTTYGRLYDSEKELASNQALEDEGTIRTPELPLAPSMR